MFNKKYFFLFFFGTFFFTGHLFAKYTETTNPREVRLQTANLIDDRYNEICEKRLKNRLSMKNLDAVSETVHDRYISMCTRHLKKMFSSIEVRPLSAEIQVSEVQQ